MTKNIFGGVLLVLTIIFAILIFIAKDNALNSFVSAWMILLSYIVMFLFLGILFVMFALPWIGDFFSQGLLGSNEELVIDDQEGKAAVKVAQGDFEGAIEIYREIIAEEPTNRFPVQEIAKLQLERLEDPQAAVDTIQESLNNTEWNVDDRSFLTFRLADIYEKELGDHDAAKQTLENAMEAFEGTRHAGNARHRIQQIENSETS